MSYKICIWGLGKIYNRLVNTLKFFEYVNAFEIVALTAKEIPAYKYLDGWRIVNKSDLNTIDIDYIIVMNNLNFDNIIDDIKKFTLLKRRNILSFRVLEIPNLNFDTYIRLKESHLSIISNNCWGGIVYRTLGFECLSPFKNLSIGDKDYIKLLRRLRYYLNCIPHFVEMNIDINNKKEYPVLLLDDVKIHCRHSSDASEAISDWLRRSKKINWENILIEIYTENDQIEKQFLDLDFKKKICFVSHPSQDNDVYELKNAREGVPFWKIVNGCAAYEGSEGAVYNLIELLSRSEKVLRLESCEIKTNI